MTLIPHNRSQRLRRGSAGFFQRFILTAALAALAITPAFAGHYELLKGKGVEVCEAYAKNLNSFKPKVPFTHARPVTNEFSDFAKPQWNRGDAAGLLPSGIPLYALYQAMGKLLWERDANPALYFRRDKWADWQGTPEQLKQAHQHYGIDRERHWVGLQVLVGRFDIDNDGKTDSVYFEEQGSLLAVFTDDWKTLDRKKTELVMPHPPFKRKGKDVFEPALSADGKPSPEYASVGYIRPVADAVHNAHYDVFFFKDRTYLDRWGIVDLDLTGKKDNPESGPLRVFELGPTATHEICSLRFEY